MIEKFIGLIKDSKIHLEFRMHIEENGNIRNRGTAWRIKDYKYLKNAYNKINLM